MTQFKKKDSVIAKVDHIKQRNYATIYKTIETYAPISRVEIAKKSQLAAASVTKITRKLLENGIINETERQTSTGGRRAISLAPNLSAIKVLAVKIGRKQLSISSYNLAAEILSNKQVDTTQLNKEQLLSRLSDEIRFHITENEQAGEKISAISVTLAGLVNPKCGQVIYHSHYNFDNFPLVKFIEQQFNIPTFIGNHTRGLALAEHYFGATQSNLDSILISVHHGVGAGLLIHGKCLLGENCNIGEIGHIQVNPAGKKCHCGNFGCLETEVSDDEIVEKVKVAILSGSITEITLETLNAENIYRAAENNDPLCQKIVEDAASYLGKTVAMLVNLLNPQKIVITGKIVTSGNTLFSMIERAIDLQTLSDFQTKLEVVSSELQPTPTIAAFALIKQAIYEGDLLQKIEV